MLVPVLGPGQLSELAAGPSKPDARQGALGAGTGRVVTLTSWN